MRHDELQIWGAEDCGSADDQSQWFRNFKLSSNHSVNRTQLQTQHALANRSGIFLLRFGATEDKSASLKKNMVGGNKGIIIVARQNSTPTRPKDISPRSRPTESGSARACPASAPLRRFSEPPQFFGNSRKTGEKENRKRSWSTGKQSPLTGSYSTGQVKVILISVIFLCRSVHSCIQFPLSVERLPL